MRRKRNGVAAAGALIALLATPALAQEAANNSAEEVVGPPQISNFSLNGTVTRPATPTPTPTPPATSPATTARPQPAPPREAAPATPQRSSDAGRSVTVDLPPPTLAEPTPVLPIPNLVGPEPQLSPGPVLDDTAAATSPLAYWPWVAAALALAGGGLLLLFLRRRRERLAYGGADFGLEPEFGAPAAEPEPLQRAAPPAPAPRATAPAAAPRAPAPAPAGSVTGLVSTRLRPWLDLTLLPDRAVIDDQGAAIEFEVVVHNTGAAPARDILVEACMFNASPTQDEELGAFFAHPVAKGDRLDRIMPLQQVTLRSTVRLTLAQMRQFEIDGRRLFVPLVGLNALYRWSGGEGQTSASYFVGRENKAEKLAPFRLDLGPKLFRGLGAREHAVRLRK